MFFEYSNFKISIKLRYPPSFEKEQEDNSVKHKAANTATQLTVLQSHQNDLYVIFCNLLSPKQKFEAYLSWNLIRNCKKIKKR